MHTWPPTYICFLIWIILNNVFAKAWVSGRWIGSCRANYPPQMRSHSCLALTSDARSLRFHWTVSLYGCSQTQFAQEVWRLSTFVLSHAATTGNVERLRVPVHVWKQLYCYSTELMIPGATLYHISLLIFVHNASLCWYALNASFRSPAEQHPPLPAAHITELSITEFYLKYNACILTYPQV